MRSTASATRAGSSLAGGSGLRVSTKQKPHARVQRSPSTMNVAVPSFQHSDRLGQPASSHTVTRSRSANVRLMRNTSSPMFTRGRNHSGLRSVMSSPASTPASARRPNKRTGSPGPSPRENRDRSSGRWTHATSCRSPEPSLHFSAAKRATMSTTVFMSTSNPSSRNDVTGNSPIPHGTMCSRMKVMSGSMFSAKPCMVRPCARRTPMALILRTRSVPTSSHTPAYPSMRPAPATPISRSVSITSCSTSHTCCEAPMALSMFRIG